MYCTVKTFMSDEVFYLQGTILATLLMAMQAQGQLLQVHCTLAVMALPLPFEVYIILPMLCLAACLLQVAWRVRLLSAFASIRAQAGNCCSAF